MEDLGYFMKGVGRAPSEETVMEPNIDEAVVFENFFNVGLRMPQHPALVEILLMFKTQLHQLTRMPLFNYQNSFGLLRCAVAS
jgi:hypothetical protein